MSAAAAYTYTSEPFHTRQFEDKVEWEPVPSIPKTHMPHTAQVAQVGSVVGGLYLLVSSLLTRLCNNRMV